MKLGIDPKVDVAFKKVFGSEDNAPLLLHLLTAVVQPTRPITGLQMALPHSDRASPADKQAIGDVRARDQGNRQFHVEMQWQVPWFFPKRALFYWGAFHPQQLRAGENYQTLRPTVLVCFLNQTLFPQVAEHHLVFRLRERTHGLEFCDDLEVHLVELPKFTKAAEELSGALDRWCYFFRHGADLDPGQLPPALDFPEIRRAMEVLAVFTQDELEREAYEQRLRAQRDHSSLMQEAREAGALFGQVRLCQELLKQPQTPEGELAAMPREALHALLAQLRQQLLPNGS